MLRITFLGTAAARPTVARNASAIAVQREGELMLFDCGEGTQRQMMRFGTGFTVNDIFFTHVHADHILGLTGLLRTMALQGRTDSIRLWTPAGTGSVLRQAVDLGVERVGFEVAIAELQTGTRLERDGYGITPYANRHGTRSFGYALVENERLGRFDPVKAIALGVPEGPLFGQLHRGASVQVGERVIRADEVVGAPRPGRRLVISGDTRPCSATVDAARAADLLIHDATFGEDEAERARSTYHSTAREAAEIATSAGALRLVLTHISARYSDDPRTLEREARAIFPGAIVAHDGFEIEIPFRDGDD
ncbi:MAG: ribonuclease Z [Gemmatimonadetes bacterium]|nr:ribonuclease Z [Gemmatimonadota bacterium]